MFVSFRLKVLVFARSTLIPIKWCAHGIHPTAWHDGEGLKRVMGTTDVLCERRQECSIKKRSKMIEGK
jgi:hypothetical protein